MNTAVQLVAVPSRTGEAGAVSDCLARILSADGFHVERPTGGHAPAPAVAVRFTSGRPGRTLQFNGHLDTVHLPFVPPTVEGDRLTGSGSSDTSPPQRSLTNFLWAILQGHCWTLMTSSWLDSTIARPGNICKIYYLKKLKGTSSTLKFRTVAADLKRRWKIFSLTNTLTWLV